MKPSIYTHIQNLLNESDLLNSEIMDLKYPKLDFFTNKNVLITGAAGSVGSELVKQLLNSKFNNLILVDNAESSLYNLQKKLDLYDKPNIHIVLIDIRDQQSVERLFKIYRPTIIFHAAAYKHVPMMESNAYEAVRLNILATKTLADLAVLNKVKKFIFISTDKAVNPISIMGMTKRIAESYLSYLNFKNDTCFKSTRFGNILGSSGSVLPIFLKQISNRKPITITNHKATRYFISKIRAAELILKIATFNKKDGYLYTFDMGKPIKILHLAHVLMDYVIGENGYKCDIQFVGLRPGEKLHEELVSKDEILEATKHQVVFRIKPKANPSKKMVVLKDISNIHPHMKNDKIKSILEDSISKLQSSPSLLFAI